MIRIRPERITDPPFRREGDRNQIGPARTGLETVWSLTSVGRHVRGWGGRLREGETVGRAISCGLHRNGRPDGRPVDNAD